VGSNPDTVYWMDVRVARYYNIEQRKIKVAKWGTPEKYFKKYIIVSKLLNWSYRLNLT
jgi:hypothetical protein